MGKEIFNNFRVIELDNPKDLNLKREFFELVPKWRIKNPRKKDLTQLEVPRLPLIEVVTGNTQGLARFMDKEPQKDTLDRFRYLLTAGLAVELITGHQRFHHDVDLVIMDYRNNWWRKYATDNVTADRYWAEMRMDPQFMEQTSFQVQFSDSDRNYEIATVHPAIIMVQKLSNAWGRQPRERDIDDVNHLCEYWCKTKGQSSWSDIINVAINALPEGEQNTTRSRITPYQRKANSARSRGLPWIVKNTLGRTTKLFAHS